MPDDLRTLTGLSCVFSFILAVLYWQSQQARTVMRTFTAYLIVIEASQWESDWRTFRHKRPRLAHYDIRCHGVIFLLLAIAGGGAPLLIRIAMFGWAKLELLLPQLTALAFGAILVWFIMHTGFRGEETREDEMEEGWSAVIGENSRTEN